MSSLFFLKLFQLPKACVILPRVFQEPLEILESTAFFGNYLIIQPEGTLASTSNMSASCFHGSSHRQKLSIDSLPRGVADLIIPFLSYDALKLCIETNRACALLGGEVDNQSGVPTNHTQCRLSMQTTYLKKKHPLQWATIVKKEKLRIVGTPKILPPLRASDEQLEALDSVTFNNGKKGKPTDAHLRWRWLQETAPVDHRKRFPGLSEAKVRLTTAPWATRGLYDIDIAKPGHPRLTRAQTIEAIREAFETNKQPVMRNFYVEDKKWNIWLSYLVSQIEFCGTNLVVFRNWMLKFELSSGSL